MKSLITSNNLLSLFSKVAISVVVLAGITQIQRSLFLPIALDLPIPPDRGAPDSRTDAASRNNYYLLFSEKKVLKSKSGSQQSVQKSSASNAINNSVNNSQAVVTCNMKFLVCPIP